MFQSLLPPEVAGACPPPWAVYRVGLNRKRNDGGGRENAIMMVPFSNMRGLVVTGALILWRQTLHIYIFIDIFLFIIHILMYNNELWKIIKYDFYKPKKVK